MTAAQQQRIAEWKIRRMDTLTHDAVCAGADVLDARLQAERAVRKEIVPRHVYATN